MVRVTSSCTVVPGQPTPIVRRRLSEIDQIQPLKHTLSIYVYKPNPNNVVRTTLFQTMKDSLAKILVLYYPLAGRLHCIPGSDRLELHCNANGVKLFEAESDSKIDDYGDFEPTKATKDLVPNFDYAAPIEEWPLLLVQLTSFRCGGLCVGIACSHVAVDGWAAIQFVKKWAKMARGEDLDPQDIPVHDRIFLEPSHPLIPPSFDNKEFRGAPLVLGCVDAKAERKKETSVAILKLSSKQVLQLKNKANSEALNNDNKTVSSSIRKPYSRFEAIAAHMWRCSCKARNGDANQPSVVEILPDIRKRWNPPIPINYSGNAILSNLTQPCTFEEILTSPLRYAAQKIREAIETMTNEYCRSAVDFLAGKKQVGCLRVGSGDGPYYGNPNVSIGSWMSLPMYDTDFGWGKPIYMGPAALDYGDGESFILPTPAGDCSLIVSLCLQTPHMESFKRCFYEDI